MPTIELIGFGPNPKKGGNSLENKIFNALKTTEDENFIGEVVIVSHPNVTVRNIKGEEKPFIRIWEVCGEDTFDRIHAVIRKVGTFDIEYATLENFFPAGK